MIFQGAFHIKHWLCYIVFAFWVCGCFFFFFSCFASYLNALHLKQWNDWYNMQYQKNTSGLTLLSSLAFLS